MVNDIDTTCSKADTLTHERAWAELKQRLGIGRIVQGIVEETQPYGVFCDVGERFPAFLDVLDVPAEPLEIGQHVRLKIVQFADWNRQIRVTLTDDRPNPSE
jgi:ribosomal protein S1